MASSENTCRFRVDRRCAGRPRPRSQDTAAAHRRGERPRHGYFARCRFGIAALTLPFSAPGQRSQYSWVLLVLPLLVVGLLPKNVDRLTHFLFKVLRREPPDHEFTLRGVVRRWSGRRSAGWRSARDVRAVSGVACAGWPDDFACDRWYRAELVCRVRRGAGSGRCGRAGGRAGRRVEPSAQARTGVGRCAGVTGNRNWATESLPERLRCGPWSARHMRASVAAADQPAQLS